MKKAVNLISLFFVFTFAFLIIIKPEICIKSTISGILICGNVIVPSLFPFSFCVLFINNSGAIKLLKTINKITCFLFGMNYYEFSLFLLSLVGGYPLGAKLLSDYKNEKSTTMINFCINAGPAFVVLAVGKGIFNNITVGWILLFSHITASFIISIISKSKTAIPKPPIIKKIDIVNNFILSASGAAETIIKISSLVILFSAICGYVEYISNDLTLISSAALLLEVTNAVFKCNNIIVVSFLLGFAGVSIWCQVLSLMQNFKINYFKFLFFRILHGTLSSAITYLILKFFKLTQKTISNNVKFNLDPFINRPAVSFSLIIMGIVLIISLYNKKYAGNLIEDIV